MATLANLVVRLTADAALYTSTLHSAEKTLGAFARNTQKIGMALSKNVSLPLAAVGAGAFLITKSVAAQGDQFAKLSQKTGVSVESLSAYKLAADLAGTSLDGLGMGMKNLAVQMVGAQKGLASAGKPFEELGLSVLTAQGQLKSTEAVMLEVAGKFAVMEDGATKTALAVDLFGKAGMDMIPFLNQGAEGMRQAAEESKKLGLTWTTQTAQAAERFQDNLTRLQGAMQGIKTGIGVSLIPVMDSLTERFTQFATTSGVMNKVKNSVEGLAQGFLILPTPVQDAGIAMYLFTTGLGPAIYGVGQLIWGLKEMTGLMRTLSVMKTGASLASLGAVGAVGAGGLALGAGALAGQQIGKTGVVQNALEKVFPWKLDDVATGTAGVGKVGVGPGLGGFTKEQGDRLIALQEKIVSVLERQGTETEATYILPP